MNYSGKGVTLIVTILVTFVAFEVHAGIVTNQSTSSSSSSSVSSKVPSVPVKSPRAGKVLYTAPYSNVRVTKHDMLISQGKPRSFGPGPVLIKSKKMEDEPSRPIIPTSAPKPIIPSTESSSESTDPDSSESPDTTTFVTEPSS